MTRHVKVKRRQRRRHDLPRNTWAHRSWRLAMRLRSPSLTAAEHTRPAPSDEAIAARLGRTMTDRRVRPPPPVADHVDDGARPAKADHPSGFDLRGGTRRKRKRRTGRRPDRGHRRRLSYGRVARPHPRKMQRSTNPAADEEAGRARAPTGATTLRMRPFAFTRH